MGGEGRRRSRGRHGGWQQELSACAHCKPTCPALARRSLWRRRGQGRVHAMKTSPAVLAALVVTPDDRTGRSAGGLQLLGSGVTVRLRGVSVVSPGVAWASGGRARCCVPPTAAPPGSASGARSRGARFPRHRCLRPASRSCSVSAPATRHGFTGPRMAARTWTRHFSTTIRRSSSMRWRSPSRARRRVQRLRGRPVRGSGTTADGGRHWTRVPADRLPAALPGEAPSRPAAPTSPGTAHVWIGTTASRVLRSTDAGRTWRWPHSDCHRGSDRHLLDGVQGRAPRRHRRRELHEGGRGDRQRRDVRRWATGVSLGRSSRNAYPPGRPERTVVRISFGGRVDARTGWRHGSP